MRTSREPTAAGIGGTGADPTRSPSTNTSAPGDVLTTIDTLQRDTSTGTSVVAFVVGATAAIWAASGAMNAVIKSGGNKFKGDFYYDYENKDFQGNNLTDELFRVGVTEGTRILLYRDPNISIGGPIKRDKFWFFGSFRDRYRIRDRCACFVSGGHRVGSASATARPQVSR